MYPTIYDYRQDVNTGYVSGVMYSGFISRDNNLYNASGIIVTELYLCSGSLMNELYAASGTIINTLHNTSGTIRDTAWYLSASGSTTKKLQLDASGNIGINIDPTLVNTYSLPNGFNFASSKYIFLRSELNGNDVGIFLRDADGNPGLDLWSSCTNGPCYIDSRWQNAPGGTIFRVATAVTPLNVLHLRETGRVGVSGNLDVGAHTSATVTVPTGFGTDSDTRALTIRSVTNGKNAGLFIRDNDSSPGVDVWADNVNGPAYVDSRWPSAGGGFIFRVATNSTPLTALSIDQTGTIKASGNMTFGPSADMYTVQTVDYSGSSSIVGWDQAGSPPAFIANIWYKKIAKMVYVWFRIDGVSNSTSANFTLPYTAANNTNQTARCACMAYDNGSALTAPALAYINPNTSTVDCYKDFSTASWTATNRKLITGEFFYESKT